MKKKRILLLTTGDYDLYILVEKNLNFLGFEVETIVHNSFGFEYKNLWQRLYNSYRKTVDGNNNYKRKLRKIYTTSKSIEKIRSSTDFDFCLVLRADFFDSKVLLEAKRKSEKIVSYHYDGLKRNPEIMDYIPIFDKFYVFDPIDVFEGSNLKTYLSHNFYFDYDVSGKQIDEKWNIYFLGYYAASREKLLLDFFEIASKRLDAVKFDIRFQPENLDRIPLYQSRGIHCITDHIPFEDYLQKIEQTSVIVDFVISDHNGLSFRIFEGLKYGKKVITTNAAIVNQDFYSPDNFYLLNQDSLDEEKLLKFINSPYNPIDNSIRLKYSFTYWLKNILSLE